jgi:hypothetical protein
MYMSKQVEGYWSASNIPKANQITQTEANKIFDLIKAS